MIFSNWSDFYASADRFDDNVAALDIINLLHVPTTEDCARNIQEQNSLAALIVDNMSGDLLLVHHMTKLRKSLKKKTAKQKEKLVALSGTGTLASPLRFEHPDDAFSKKHIVEVDIPSDTSLEAFESFRF